MADAGSGAARFDGGFACWVPHDHDVPDLVRSEVGVPEDQVNEDLRQRLTAASVRTEAFVTIVVPETRMARPAKESGGGLEGRARVLYGLMGEVGAQLRGGLAITQVTWLTSPELAVAWPSSQWFLSRVFMRSVKAGRL
jgi:hypothetical protein